MAFFSHPSPHLRRSVLGLLIAVLLVGMGIRAGNTASAQNGAVSVTGILNIVYGDPITVYTLTDPQNPAIHRQLLIDDKAWQSSVSIHDLNRQLVTVSGVAAGAGVQTAAVSAAALAVADIKPAGGASAAAPAQPVNGAQAYINLLCRFQDIATEQHPPSWYDTLLGIGGNGTTVPTVDNYFRDNSYGNITLAGSITTPSWRSLPHPMSYYGDGTNSNPNIGTNLHNMAQDCANTWATDTNLAPYIGLNIVMNGAVFQTAWGGTDTLTLNGTVRTVGATWFNVTYGEYMTVWCHEMGHAFGLAHSGSDAGTEYADAYDVMGYGYYAAPAGQPYVYWGEHTIGYHKDKLGWIPAARKFTYSSGSNTITLEQLGTMPASNYLLAQIPYPGGPATHFYTVEFRQKVGSYENQLPVPATGTVVIFDVDTTRRVPAWVQGDGTATSGPATAAAAYQWTAGRTWSGAGGLKVIVNSVSGTSASVTIGVPSPVTVTGLSISSGAASGGTPVTVTGTGFSTTPGGSTVKFGATAATAQGGGTLTCTATQCLVSSPAGTGTVDVTVTTSGGTSTTSAADQFTYASCTPGASDLTSPSGTTISSATPTFVWAGGGCITAYHLYIGSTSGGADLFDGGQVPASTLSQVVAPAIPLNGQTIYERLWSLANGTWLAVDHTFTMQAPCNNVTRADITSPSGGSISTGTPTFQWGGGACVTQYYLYVGSAAGQADLFSSGALTGAVSSATVSPAIPLDGRTIYVRLWSLVSGSFQAVDRSYTMGACNNGTRADITSPGGGSISTGTPTFQWGGGACVTQYYLYIGNASGQADLFNSGPLASNVSSATVSPAIPVDGRTIYVRLWSLVSGGFQAVDHSYIMGACNNGTKADITSPAGGSITTGTPTFQWGGGACVTQYYFYVGSAAGTNDLFSANALPATSTSATVSPAIPVDGRTIYVRLWSLVNGSFQAVDHSYLMGACQNPSKATISSPAGGTLSGASQVFQWSGGACVTQYFLYVGSAFGQADLYSSGALASTVSSQTVTVPANNSTVYVRLWSLVNGSYQAVDRTYVSTP